MRILSPRIYNHKPWFNDCERLCRCEFITWLIGVFVAHSFFQRRGRGREGRGRL
uniref:Uncharacterized protein n=1 Tax=Parascaris equorum TaxID=6256 RepID=A0A914RGW0_PAREQ